MLERAYVWYCVLKEDRSSAEPFSSGDRHGQNEWKCLSVVIFWWLGIQQPPGGLYSVKQPSSAIEAALSTGQVVSISPSMCRYQVLPYLHVRNGIAKRPSVIYREKAAMVPVILNPKPCPT